MSSECAGFARDFAMVEDQVRFLTGTLGFVFLVVEGGVPCAGTISTNTRFFRDDEQASQGIPLGDASQTRRAHRAW